jgi:hypothetical protein
MACAIKDAARAVRLELEAYDAEHAQVAEALEAFIRRIAVRRAALSDAQTALTNALHDATDHLHAHLDNATDAWCQTPAEEAHQNWYALYETALGDMLCPVDEWTPEFVPSTESMREALDAVDALPVRRPEA